MLPNLVIAGAPKCGTSSIFRWLTDHPEVVGSYPKETCYFADPGTHTFNNRQNYSIGGVSGYERFFPPEARSARLVVEATPTYLYSDLAVRQLPNIPSTPRVVLIFRDPVRQIRSTYSYFKNNWNWVPPRMSMREFIAANLRGEDCFRGNELAQYALRNACYIDYALRWQEACGRERLHVLVFEEVVRNPCKEMKGLVSRLGIDPAFYDEYDFPRENETYRVRFPGLQRVNIALREKFPRGHLYQQARAFYRAVNTVKHAADELKDDDLDRSLASMFVEPNERLAEHFGLEISTWSGPSG